MNSQTKTEARDLIRVYDFPNGFLTQAQSMFGWLQHERFTPGWDNGVRDGEYRYGITLPEHEIPQLRALQTANPARWGNHPDVAQALADSASENEARGKIYREKLSILTPDQREWIEVIHQETGLDLWSAIDLNESLHELAAQHYSLCVIHTLEGGLNDQQRCAQDAIEARISALLDGIPGIKGVRFLYDPRGTTVGVKFESGRHDSFTGTYKVPLDPARTESLMREPFWESYPGATKGPDLALD